MSRYDKYEPRVGGFRAKLAAAILAADVGKIQAVSINGSGQVVIGGAGTDLVGVICAVRPMSASEPIDVMTSGEIANATATGGAALTAGSKVYAHTGGVVDTTATSGLRIGNTIEADRVVIRFAMAAPAAFA